MSTSTTSNKNESLTIWRVKLELAFEGSYQAIQEVKEHVLESTDQSHPIFKQSFYEILQQGYQLHQLLLNNTHPRSYDTFKDFPLFFLISGCVQVKCINLEGDNETVLVTKNKGLVSVEEETLAKKYGQQNVNLLTKFQIHATEDSILLEILGSNKIHEIVKRKEITEKESNVMKRFLLFPSKEIVRMTVNPTNHDQIKDRLYLLSGKACYYLDDETTFGKRLILSCFEEGYLNPKQFVDQLQEDVPSGCKIEEKPKKKVNIKLYIFEKSEIMYLEENFLKDDMVKGIEMKRNQHLLNIIEKYKQIKTNSDALQKAQSQLIARFKLSKKEINTQIHKIVEVKREKEKLLMTAKESSNDKRGKGKADLIATSSSLKCSIRIRKSKKMN